MHTIYYKKREISVCPDVRKTVNSLKYLKTSHTYG